MNTQIYLDYAAATPLDERVFRVMEPYFTDNFYNPSAAYSAARSIRNDLDEARQALAAAIGAKRDEVILTAGATESINLAFKGIMKPGDNVVVGATEHQSVLAMSPLFDTRIAQSDAKGIITPDAVLGCIDDETILVSVTAADSELGTIQPLSKIAEALNHVRRDRKMRGIETPLYFHSDASQAAGVIDLHVARIGVDLLTLNAAKCYGPKQVGLLWVAANVQLQPLIVGGGQERGLRAGTENVAGAIGFAYALTYAQKHRHTESDRLRTLRDELETGLLRELPEMIVNGSKKKRLPGHLNFSIDQLDAERVVFHLDSVGVMVATGAACAANKGTRSSVLVATGMSNSLADGSLRISLGRKTTQDEIKQVIPRIVEAVRTESKL